MTVMYRDIFGTNFLIAGFRYSMLRVILSRVESIIRLRGERGANNCDIG